MLKATAWRFETLDAPHGKAAPEVSQRVELIYEMLVMWQNAKALKVANAKL
jgi:hypothetical protein